MPMRLSGLMSGMDTESVIEQLVAVKRTKVDDAKKAQTKLQWKQDAWKTLNAKIRKLYDGAISNMRFESSYMKKTTSVSNSSVVSVITGEGAMNSVQSLKVKKMAQSGYLTGERIGGEFEVKADTKLLALGIDTSSNSKIRVTVGGEEKEIDLGGATTVGELVQTFRDAGLNASFDTKNQRFYLASKDTGVENDFSVSAVNAAGLDALEKLGLNYVDDGIKAQYQQVIDSRDETLQGRLNGKLAELTSERTRLQGLLEAKRDILKSDGIKDEFDGYDLDSKDPAELQKIMDHAKELYDSDPVKYAALEDWGGSWNNLSGRLNNLESQLTIGVDGSVEGLSQEVTNSITGEVDAMISAYQAAVDGASGAIKNQASDAVIELNGVEYTGSRNTFDINGLTMTINSVTKDDETVTLTTKDDTDGIYDMIKNFFKEYNELINEMDKLYNADAARGYEPLTSEEKEAMSDSEVEEWEKKIKDSLLRRDSTLGTVSTAIKQLMMSGVSVNGKQMYLSDFGIETLSYFTAPKNEKNAYHIDGDADDVNTSGNADKLRSMIADDPQTVVDFFVGLSRNLYSELTDRMARTEYSSSYTVYEDIRMKSEYDSYTSKIKDLEKKLADYEDKWYAKFADMETAMAKMQSNASAVTSLLGG